MESIAIPIRDLTKRMTLNVKITGARGWEFRLEIARVLFRLGAWISGMGIKIEIESEVTK